MFSRWSIFRAFSALFTLLYCVIMLVIILRATILLGALGTANRIFPKATEAAVRTDISTNSFILTNIPANFYIPRLAAAA